MGDITSVRVEVMPSNVSYVIQVMDDRIDQVACIYDSSATGAVAELVDAVRMAVLNGHPDSGVKPASHSTQSD
jgi:hypothetical protein